MMVFKDKSTELKVFAALYTIPTILHTVGLYMLFTTRITRLAYNQKLYLINISISELLICVFKISHRLFSLYDYSLYSFKLWTIQTSGCFMAYIIFMVLLSVDRFLEVYLNIKYPIFVTKRTAHFSVLIVWLVSAMFAMALVLQNSDNHVRRVVILYFWPSSELTFLLIALLVYTYLFVKIRKYRKKTNRISTVHDTGVVPGNHNHVTVASTTVGADYTTAGNNNTTVEKLDKEKAFNRRRRKSSRYKHRLYLPTFLVSSFIILWIVPDQVEFVAILMKKRVPLYFWFLINILITCALCMDAFIYIFGVQEIRRRLQKLRGRWRCGCSLIL